jgi:hypothetical protein
LSLSPLEPERAGIIAKLFILFAKVYCHGVIIILDQFPFYD